MSSCNFISIIVKKINKTWQLFYTIQWNWQNLVHGDKCEKKNLKYLWENTEEYLYDIAVAKGFSGDSVVRNGHLHIQET